MELHGWVSNGSNFDVGNYGASHLQWICCPGKEDGVGALVVPWNMCCLNASGGVGAMALPIASVYGPNRTAGGAVVWA